MPRRGHGMSTWSCIVENNRWPAARCESSTTSRQKYGACMCGLITDGMELDVPCWPILPLTRTVWDTSGSCWRRYKQAAAMALYEAFGFHSIAPFGPYADDPTSVCFELALERRRMR